MDIFGNSENDGDWMAGQFTVGYLPKKSKKRILKEEIKRLKKKIKKLEKTNKKYHMYEKAGCSKCKDGICKSYAHDDLSVDSWWRCECSETKTEKYRKWLKKHEVGPFYDNHNSIKTGNNATNRSW